MFRRPAVVFLALILAATAALAGQGPHRARLSADLEQHLASPAVPTVAVIVTGSRTDRRAGRAPRPDAEAVALGGSRPRRRRRQPAGSG